MFIHRKVAGIHRSGEGKTVTLKVTTSDEYLNVQITDMKGNDSVKTGINNNNTIRRKTL